MNEQEYDNWKLDCPPEDNYSELVPCPECGTDMREGEESCEDCENYRHWQWTPVVKNPD